MPIRQTRLFGASLANFSASVGWNAEQSTCTLTLAEDKNAAGEKQHWAEYDGGGNIILKPNGVISSSADIFSPPPIGYPVHFKISDDASSFFFNGLLQDWRQHNGSDGEIYEVTIVDPRHILAGCQVIIDNFTGSVNNVPNLINAYGYLESISYGNSRVNEAGLPWNKFLEAINVVINSFPQNLSIAQYGGPLKFRGQTYRLDLSSLPSAPQNYRLSGGSSISLMDAISQLCEDSGRDFIVKLIFTGGLNYIKVYTVSRRTQPSLTRIQQYLNTVPNVVVKNRGLELRAENTSSFLVGEKVQQLYKQQLSVTYDNGTMFDLFGYTAAPGNRIAELAPFVDMHPNSNGFAQKFNVAKQDAIQNTIWPYWGLDANGSAIVGIGFGPHHTFRIDSRRMSHITGVGQTMILHHAELQAALAGEAEWISWVVNFSTDKSEALGLADLADLTGTILEFEKDLKDMNFLDTINMTAKKLLFLANPKKMELIHQLYEFIYGYATEYYGRKYMVRLPFVFAKIEDDTTRMVTSYEPADSAFLSESDWNSGNSPFGLPELFWDFFQPEGDGKFGAFVRFDNVEAFNLADMNAEDYVVVYGNNGEGPTTTIEYDVNRDELSTNQATLTSRLYIRCEIDPNLVFIDRANASDPRVVITLPAPITPKPEDQHILNVTKFANDFCEALAKKGAEQNDEELQAAWERLSDSIKNCGFTGEPGKYGSYPLGAIPYYAAVPLRSNTLRYGPWYAVGAQGGVRYEQNDTLAPWNFNGYTLMNQTANALVSEAYTNMQIAELGDVQIPGVPNIELGNELIIGGPIVSNIRCSVGQDGITTNYNMETYKINPYGLNKQNYDRIQRLNKELIQVRRNLLEQERTSRWVSQSSKWNPALVSNPRRISKNRGRGSPHSIIMMSTIDGIEIESPEDGQHTHQQRIEGSFRSVEETLDNLAFYAQPDGVEKYKKVAIGTLDNLYVPFSTNTENIFLPHFVEPANPDDASNRSVNHLHPYYDDFSDSENPVSKTHAQIVTFGDTYPQEGIQTLLKDGNQQPIFDGQKVQSIALRGPVIIAGWGYDIDNKPVPNEDPDSPTDNFIENYRLRPDLWPAGPLDVKWDKDRGVWSASASMVEGLLSTALTPSGSATLNIYNIIDGVWTDTEETVQVTDRAGWLVNSGKWLMATKINGQHRPVAAECG